MDEAHVEHAIGFIENEDFESLEVDGTLLVEIQKATRGGDEDVDATADFIDLRVGTDSAENNGGSELEVLAVGRDAFGDLCGELARGSEHKGAGFAIACRFSARKAMQKWEREAGGFSGSGLGRCHDIAAGHDCGDGLGLDRSRGVVAGIDDGFQDEWVKTQGVEFFHRGGLLTSLRVGLIPSNSGHAGRG